MAEQLELDENGAELLRTTLKLEDLFPKMTREDVRLVFPNSGLYRYKKDDYVIYQGDDSKDLFVLYAGLVTITQTLGTAGVELAKLKPGDIFGEIALIRDGVRVASAIAAQESTIFRLAQKDVESLVTSNPALAERLKKLAEERTA